MSGHFLRGDDGEMLYVFACTPSEIQASGACGVCYVCGEEAEVCEQCGHAVCRTCILEAEGCSVDACDCMACLSRVEEGYDGTDVGC